MKSLIPETKPAMAAVFFAATVLSYATNPKAQETTGTLEAPAATETTSTALLLPDDSTTTTTQADPASTPTIALSPSGSVLFAESLDPLTTESLVVGDFSARLLSNDLGSASLSPDQSPRNLVSLPGLADYERQLISAKRPRVRISAQNVVARTIQKNLAIRQRQISRARAGDEVRVQQGIFDLTVRGLVQALRDETPTELNPRATAAFSGVGEAVTLRRTTQSNLEAGLDQLLSTGGSLSLSVNNRRTESNASGFVASPLEEAGANLTFRQPLLRDAGPFVTRSQITIAQLGERASMEELRAQLLQEISFSLQLYYDLVFAVANVDVLRVSLAQAEELLRVNTAKYNAGVLPELDVLQAQADVASRLQDVLVAIQLVEQASDRLRTQLAEIGDTKDVSLRPADRATVPSVTLNEKASVSTALQRRPELEIAALLVEQSNVRVGVSQNATLPRLDAQVGVGLSGANRTAGDAFDDLYDREGSSWNAGLAFSYPLQNRSARGRLSQSRRDMELATLQRQQVRDQILLDVRSAIRSVETNRQKVAVGRATVEFNQAKVESGQKRQQVGLATSFDVLAFQRDLANARSQLLQSIVDLNKSVIQLEQSKGTLLDQVGVNFRSRTQAATSTESRPRSSQARSQNNRTSRNR